MTNKRATPSMYKVGPTLLPSGNPRKRHEGFVLEVNFPLDGLVAQMVQIRPDVS